MGSNGVQKKNDDKSSKPVTPIELKFWGMTKFEWIMACLTLAGVIIAVFTGLIFWKQLAEMRTDQRAWVTMTLGTVQFPANESEVDKVQVRAPLTLNNVGKTAARNLSTRVIMEYEVNGQGPDFAFDKRIWAGATTGIMFPNSTQNVPVIFWEGKPNDKNGQPRFLTRSEFQDLIKGDGYMVVYAETTYTDIFGTLHWSHYCTFFVAPQATSVFVSAKGCTDYNDTDHD